MAEVGGPAQDLPDTVLCREYRLVWAATGARAAGGRSAAIWRPVGPPGYSALGDVAVKGREPPPRPVRVYKDAPVLAAAAVNTSGSGDALASEGPRLAPPVGYTLIFRDGASLPLTLSAFDSAVWSGASSDNSYWRCCSVWPVDSAAGTFVAVKGEGRPAPHLVREPIY
ncbi:hypothetical protein TSOC_013061 [Tetrabaena socialis]|uniref:Uncharacterized protein n=1 Tax=Tetrabaena socialis TaxID=47790 RepID=A0A2J7ZLD1_9CHLO|nr:hypothetical protein TSOC_013061 [Tetrabaena socialis]|eukprot:PNH01074.1 hypothetical protein TSOC_013061 [Tetrabaena socialis]